MNNKNSEKKPITKKEIVKLWFMIFTLKIRNYFFTGIIVLVPIGFTLYLSKFLMNASSNLLPSKVNPNSYLPINIPGIEIIITIFFITFIGFLSLSFLGKKFLQLIDILFKKIPLLGTFWSAVKQMSQSFKDNKHKKRSVVLVEYPRKGVWAVGFATKENEGEIKNKTNKELINVFVPTTPNPTSGFLLMFEKNDIIYLDMSFEEASKFVVSAGTTSP
ncbi:DUF502 domain-containing protein [Candidatus Pelagibacter ubique]|jgi:uncharacterized membrane protein|nr:DUF502 domain-containing protein [Candidatus Pelagibacter bacterium]MDA7488091.1 DUF502 domain-containing protein [Candidatus Pelagibacter ubique]MDA8836797.1 DUF502 domain-containing protein [Candidatus Pelagibacter bacterium]MDA9200790.1 DUF502 domain-containing protein [Candidatus Pelagibacter ubique]MDC0558729.1 DUF502 domain-containing protein [Candidatus Pelagibacter ubique]MDC6463841.1 DUF502 domain-containing protein [Candidatus Pelagibacter ubique]